MGQVEVFSPAKINLFLSVLGRMDSGFHELVSLVTQLDFGDTLRIEAEEAEVASVELICSDERLPVDRSNLAYAAAEGFVLRSGLNWRVRIELEKRIPFGAGLGGGSSNACAVLRGLSELAAQAGALGLSRGERLELAAELGSDCPLFLERRPVVMRGRGERLTGVDAGLLDSLQLVLFKPSFSINTGWAYRSLVERGDCYDAREWAEGRIADWVSGRVSTADLLHNSFQASAFAKFVAFEPLFERLRRTKLDVLMSGSGSCCFALVGSEEEANEVEKRVRDCWGERTFVQRARVLG